MSLTQCEAALRTAIETVLSPIPVAQSNIPFRPPSGRSPWARITFMPSQPQPVSLGVGGRDRADGINQVDLMFPLGTGDTAANVAAAALEAYFNAQRIVSYSGQYVNIRSCGRADGSEEISEGLFVVRVTIAWYAFWIRS